MPLAGVLNVNKPTGLTSFAVVARVRRMSQVRRVGHAGTLDPLASGVLLVCLGQATRIVPYLQEQEKVYLAGIRLGQLTTTYDAQGELTREVPIPSKLDLSSFIGEIWQSPPIFSALKRAGRPLYEYARAGKELKIERRQVRIYGIDVVEWQPPLVTLRVHCGKGTYIRSLANDLGGHLISLVRERVGRFRVEDAINLDELTSWENRLVPIAEALSSMRRMTLEASEAHKVLNGLSVDAPAGEVLALDSAKQVVAILSDGHPKIVFRNS